jgi:hypothetical protein
MAKRDEVPDLGIDTTPRGPVKLSRRPRSLVSSGRLMGWSRAFWGTLGAIGVFLLWGVVELASEAISRPADRGPIARQARDLAPAPDAVVVVERERIDAQAEEAREKRLREASRLINRVIPVVQSADLDDGRRQAFLQLHSSGNFYSSIVEAGACREYAGEDRYFWETATPEELAAMWACRDRDGDFRVKSVARQAFSLTAVVVDRKRGRRFRLDMNGFDAVGGTPLIAMTPLD